MDTKWILKHKQELLKQLQACPSLLYGVMFRHFYSLPLTEISAEIRILNLAQIGKHDLDKSMFYGIPYLYENFLFIACFTFCFPSTSHVG